MEQNTGMNKKCIMLFKKRFSAVLTAALLLVVAFYSAGCADKNADLSSQLPPQIDVSTSSVADMQGNIDVQGTLGEHVVEVSDGAAAKGSEDKMVEVSFANAGRANPFLPARESKALAQRELFKFDLIEPPTAAASDSPASKIVTTKISGIMFDNYNPSAILNIEGSDYLVRSGDVINGYKVLAISPSTVTVQLGKNVYKAGVGEVVTEGDVNYNTISNLSRKFGGNTGNNKKK